MGYTALKIVSFLIQFLAIVLAVAVISLFVFILAVYNSFNAHNQQYPQELAFLFALFVPAPLLLLFSGLLSSLIIFGFGGLLSVVVDISRSLQIQAVRDYIPPPDDDPVNPKPWAEFPASPFAKQPKKNIRPTSRNPR